MTPTSTNQITAEVTYFNPEKLFGFAAGPDGKDVFFHMAQCREVEGTPEEPRITTQRSDKLPKWFRGCRWPSKITAKVIPSPKGLKAEAWGLTPTRTWVEELEHVGTLQRFAGGHVVIGYSAHYRGRATRRSTGKLTEAPSLVRSGDEWRLGVSYQAYDGPGGTYGEPSAHLQLTFPLWGAQPEHHRRDGRYMLDVHLATGEWAYIMFYPPGEWIGN